MGYLKILAVLLIMSDVCSRMAFARSTKRVDDDYGTDDDSETEYYDGGEDGDGDEGEERGDEFEIETNRKDDDHKSSKSKIQNSRTDTGEEYKPKVSDKAFVSVGRKEASYEASHPSLPGPNSGNEKLLSEEEREGAEVYSESVRKSNSETKLSLDSKDEKHSDELAEISDIIDKNFEEKSFASEHEERHSIEVSFPLNPLYSDGSPKDDDSIVVQTIDEEKVDFNGPQGIGISSQAGRMAVNTGSGSDGGEIEFEVDEVSRKNPEPVPLSKELEGLVEISPLKTGNNLDTTGMGLGEKLVLELTLGSQTNASNISTSTTTPPSQSNDTTLLKTNATENTKNETKLILLDSDIDVKGSGSIRRSAELAASAMDLERAEGGSEIEELGVEEDVKLEARQSDPIELEQVPAEDASNPCNLPVVTGSCKGAFPRFYYSPAVHSCIPFTFTGCGQNANNFEKEEDCMAVCEPNRKSRNSVQLVKKKLEFGSSATGTGIYSRNRVRRKFPLAFCSLELDLGDICPDLKRGLYLEQFYYDSRINQCSDFVYSGCGGNANRFSSMWECTQNCVTAPTTNPPSSAVYDSSFRL